MLETFAVVAPLDGVAAALRDRWGGVIQRLSFYAPYEMVGADRWDTVIADLKPA
jgi:hypothetical protein